MELQTGKHRDLEVMLKAENLAHPICLHIQGKWSDSKVHNLATRLLGSGSQCSGLPMDPDTWCFPPSPVVPLSLFISLIKPYKSVTS